jgi:cholest-4-en-3-one 26-monooxygenase
VIDGVDGRAEFDYMEQFAEVIPAYVVATALGSPRADLEWMAQTVKELFRLGQEVEKPDDGDSALALENPALNALIEYAGKMQRLKLAEPGDDMFTELARCVEREEAISRSTCSGCGS